MPMPINSIGLEGVRFGWPYRRPDRSEGEPTTQRMNGRRFARGWMGKPVLVRAVVRDHARVELREPVTGWVAGYTRRLRGERVWEGEEVGYVFENRGPSTPVILVCPWPGRKTLDAAVDGVELWDGEMQPPGWSKEERDIARAYAAEQGRDESGRWTR